MLVDEDDDLEGKKLSFMMFFLIMLFFLRWVLGEGFIIYYEVFILELSWAGEFCGS